MSKITRTLVLVSACNDETRSSFVSALNRRGMLVPDNQSFENNSEIKQHFRVEDEELMYFVIDGPESVKVSTSVSEEFKDSFKYLHCSTPESARNDFSIIGLSFVSERTLCIIKPDAAKRAREITNFLRKHGFTVIRMKKMQMSQVAAQEFYAEHTGREFFDPLTAFISSGPLFALVLERYGAISAYRQLLGPTNSNKAREIQPGSIRALFGTDGRRNACHGSDSPESADREINFFFPELSLGYGGDFESFVKEIMSAKDEMVDGSQGSGKGAQNSSLSEILTRGLKAVFTAKPADPVQYLGRWLLQAAPAKIDY